STLMSTGASAPGEAPEASDKNRKRARSAGLVSMETSIADPQAPDQPALPLVTVLGLSLDTVRPRAQEQVAARQPLDDQLLDLVVVDVQVAGHRVADLPLGRIVAQPDLVLVHVEAHPVVTDVDHESILQLGREAGGPPLHDFQKKTPAPSRRGGR